MYYLIEEFNKSFAIMYQGSKEDLQLKQNFMERIGFTTDDFKIVSYDELIVSYDELIVLISKVDKL